MRNILVMLMLLAFGNAAHAAELFATVDSLSGKAFVSADDMQWKAVSVGQKIYAGQTIATDDDGEVHLETVDGGIIAIRPDTEFRVDEYKAEGGPDDKVYMSLVKGAMRSITGWIGQYTPSGYRVTTPTATIGIRGTDHETTVIEETDGDEAGTYDMVNEGETVLKTKYGESVVTPEKFAFAPRYRAVAPVFLAQKPMFWAKRKLVIEGLIPQRKAQLRDRIKQLREDRIKQLEKTRDKPAGKVSAKEARKKVHANQRKKAEQRRDVLRKEKVRNATQRGGNEKAKSIKREQRPRPEHKIRN
ncbi:MAG TPA: FecR domain-containing protein [Gallionella sp.]|nr:FecR domain-containing protein [Gallionella sp.]